MKDLFAKISLSFIFKIMSALLAYPTAILLARQLGSEGFGIYGFVIALVGLMIYPIVLGQDQLVVRQAALVKEHYQNLTHFPLVSFSLKFIWAISVAVSLIITVLIIIYPTIFSIYTDTILFGVWILPFFAVRRIYTSLLRVLDKPVLAIFPESFVQPLVIFCLLIFSLVIFEQNITPQIAIIFQLSAYATSMVLVCVFCRNKQVNTKASQPFAESIKKITWVKAGFIMALMATAEGFAMYIDRFMLGVFRPVEEVGVYLVAARNTGFVLFLESAFLLVTMPIIAKRYSKNENISTIISIQSMIVFIFTGAFFLLFFFLGEWIVALFGGGFETAYLPMLILSGAYFLGSFFGAGPHILMMTGHEKISSNILVSTTLLNIVLNVVLITLYGVVGAALATFISEVMKKYISYIFLKRYIENDVSVLSVNKALCVFLYNGLFRKK
tara:strand:+ start:6962 stop:8287 length:1326 start_codon:yes stop_codon:yes gene_type:complete